MPPSIFLGFAIIIASVLFLGGLCILGFGMFMLAKATGAIHQARAHGAEADATAETLVAAKDAVDDMQRHARDRAAAVAEERPPGDDEITAGILLERLAARERAMVMTNGETEMPTMDGNEGASTSSPSMDGGFYATGTGQP